MRGLRQQDLVVLAADNHIVASLRFLLVRRREALGLREVSFDILRHPNSDPGCLSNAIEFLRPFAREYKHAVVIFDYAGCGSRKSPHEIQQDLENMLERSGWPERARVIVIDPEVEVWIWGHSGKIAEVLGWGRDFSAVRESLEESGLWPRSHNKPLDPKKAVRHVLRGKRRPLSSSLFEELAEVTGVRQVPGSGLL